MRTWGLMLNFIPLGWNAVLKYQHLGVDLLQVKGRQVITIFKDRAENIWQNLRCWKCD